MDIITDVMSFADLSLHLFMLLNFYMWNPLGNSHTLLFISLLSCHLDYFTLAYYIICYLIFKKCFNNNPNNLTSIRTKYILIFKYISAIMGHNNGS